MKTDQILAEIHEANLSYLMLAKSLLMADRRDAMARLGINEQTADSLAVLTAAQMSKIARTNTLLHRFEMNDDIVFGLLTSHSRRAANADQMPAAAEKLVAA